MPMEKEGKGDEFDLSLELSIGGRYGTKPEGPGKQGDTCVYQVSNNCSSLSGPGLSDPQSKRDIQAMRRQEARKKREERVRKSRGSGFVEDKLFLEAQKFQGRVQDREARERDGISEARKGRNGGNDEARSYPKLQHGYAGECVDSDHINRNGSSERSTSPASDYQSTSHKGGSSSDTGSHSSLQPDNALPTRAALNQPQLDQNTLPTIPQPSWTKFAEKSKGSPNETGSSRASTVPPLNHNANAVPHMPCVSATGNGPSGKTITGFLYKYTNNEVSIMCVCHGCSFSPAEFVEHAGGVNISNPLRHITVIPSSLGCS